MVISKLDIKLPRISWAFGPAISSLWRSSLIFAQTGAWVLWMRADMIGRPYMAPVLFFFACSLSFAVLIMFCGDRVQHSNMRHELGVRQTNINHLRRLNRVLVRATHDERKAAMN